jgi:hypothetical protein
MSITGTSFYQTGGNLPHNASSYVERQADMDLYEGLTRGEYCYVLTSRQMGKSSLMVHTAARLKPVASCLIGGDRRSGRQFSARVFALNRSHH